MDREVVITGVGAATAFGLGFEPLWKAMNEGRSAVRRLERFAEAGMPGPFAAELDPDAFDVRTIVPRSYRKATKVMCRDIELAVGAAADAVADAGLVTKATDGEAPPTIDPRRVGCQIGAGLIAAEIDELAHALVTSRTADGTVDLGLWGHTGMQHLTPLWMLKYLPNMLACHVTIVHDCRGPSNTITCAEASSPLSLGESLRVIARGDAEACLSGGAECKLNPFAWVRQRFAGRLTDAGADADPASVLRPFAADADGSVIGEGGGILVVEAAESARGRGAAAQAIFAGFGASQSIGRDPAALRIDADDPGLGDAIAVALADAGVDAGDVDAIVPYGSSIPAVDACERAAIERVFGARAPSIPLVLTVPFTGNCAAGQGAIAVAVAVRMLRDQRLPARLNASAPVGLDAGPAPARDAALDTILVFTPSQGGQNAAIVLRRA